MSNIITVQVVPAPAEGEIVRLIPQPGCALVLDGTNLSGLSDDAVVQRLEIEVVD